jgi:glycosyltransferase involved in cell wall biosynthesis
VSLQSRGALPTDAGRPHVLYVVPFRAEFSGADRDFIHIVNRLPDRYRLTIVALADGELLGEQLQPTNRVHVLTIPFAIYPYMLVQHQRDHVNPLRYLRFMRWLYMDNRRALRSLDRQLAGDKIDLVHSWVSTIPLGAMFAHRERVPHIWHTREAIYANTYKQRIWRWFMNRYADVILAPTESTSRAFGDKASALSDGAPIDEIRARYREAETGYLQREYNLADAFIICQTGVVHVHKGQLDLVKAIAQLRRQRPDLRVHAFLLGKWIAPDYIQEVQAAIAANDLHDSVHLMGYRHDYLSFLKLADIIVHPSPLPDSYPNAVRDAMILGKPVIAAATGGIPDMIEDGRDGILVPPGDVSSLADAICLLYSRRPLRATLAKNAFQSSETKFNVETTVAQLCKVYDHLLAR